MFGDMVDKVQIAILGREGTDALKLSGSYEVGYVTGLCLECFYLGS